jgi:hypothetical protein
VGTVVGTNTRWDGHFEMAVDGRDLQLRAGGEPELVTQRLGDHQAASHIDGGPHGMKIPWIFVYATTGFVNAFTNSSS